MNPVTERAFAANVLRITGRWVNSRLAFSLMTWRRLIIAPLRGLFPPIGREDGGGKIGGDQEKN